MNMKRINLLLLGFVFALFTFGQARAQGFSDNFSTAQGYTGGNTSLDGQVGWSTNDPLNMDGTAGDTSFVSFLAGYTSGSSGAGNNSVAFGGYGAADGYYPGRIDPDLSKSFTTPIVNGDPSKSTALFTTDFAIIDSFDGSYPAKDIFGFDLRNSSDVSLVKFAFNPLTATTSDLNIQWIKDGVVQTTANPALLGNYDVGYQAKYRLSVALTGTTFTSWIQLLNSSNNVIQTVNLVLNGALSAGGTATDFTKTVMTWNLTNTTPTDPGVYGNAGSNYLIDNSISVTAVPEPSTWAIAVGLVGLMAFHARRRRLMA